MTETKAPRLLSVDLLRGLIMAIMVLDHVRDFFTWVPFPPENLELSWGTLFFTRWITHFCAPNFFFLAGTGACLAASRGRAAAALPAYLAKRGAWLIFLEFTFVYWGWTFLFPRPGSILLVIWALGCSMLTLALLVRFMPSRAVGAFGIALIALHNLTDTLKPEAFGRLSWVWNVLHRPGLIPVPGTGVQVFAFYPLIPWVGVMAAGYGFGAVLKLPAERRRRVLVGLGLSLSLLFVVLRATNFYGNPPAGFTVASQGAFVPQPTLVKTVISFLNVEKYPPSLQFLLMTLGPSFLLLAWFDRFDLRSPKAALGRVLWVFGRVPFFFYVVHIYLVHVMALVVAVLWHQPTARMLHGGIMAPLEPGYGHGLAFVYLMWALALALLYLPCRWFLGVKERRRDWWLSYL